MAFHIKLKEAALAAAAIGTKESRIVFVSANDTKAVLFPLNECACVVLRASPLRQYGRGVTKHPAMVSTNLGHWHDGVAHWGGMQWYVDSKQGKLIAWDGKTKLPENARPEGYLMDLHETDRIKEVCFKPTSPIHQVILDWVGEMFAETINTPLRAGSLYPEVITPNLVAPISTVARSKNWLTLRQGFDLDNEVEAIVNHSAYVIPGLDMTALADGVVKPGPNGSYIFTDEDGDEQKINNPTAALQDLIFKAFGQAVAVKLYPMITKETKVVKNQTIFTPIRETVANPSLKFTVDELKRRPDYQTLQYIAVLASSFMIPEVYDELRSFVNTDLAYTRDVPYVYLAADYPRVQRLKHDQAALRSIGASYRLDMIDTPMRTAMRRNKANSIRLLAERNEALRLMAADAAKAKADAKPLRLIMDDMPEVKVKPTKVELVGEIDEPYDLEGDKRLLLRLLGRDSQVFKSRQDIWQRLMEKSDIAFDQFEEMLGELEMDGYVQVTKAGKVLRVSKTNKKLQTV